MSNKQPHPHHDFKTFKIPLLTRDVSTQLLAQPWSKLYSTRQAEVKCAVSGILLLYFYLAVQIENEINTKFFIAPCNIL